MDKYRSTRVTHVSKLPRCRWKAHSLSQVIPIHTETKYTIDHSTSSLNPLRTSTNSSDLNALSPIKSVANPQKSTDSSSTIDSVKPLSEKPEKKRRKCVRGYITKCPFLWIIGLPLLSACILIAMAVVIYMLVFNKKITATTTILSSSTTTITVTTTTTTSFSFEWNSTGITVAGITASPGTAGNQLTSPFGLALDSSNTLYIADRGNNRVQKWLMDASNGTTVAGQFNGASGTALNCLNTPAAVEVDSNGNIYVTEIFNYRVLFWPSGASSGTIVAGNGSAGSLNNQLNQPHDIAHDWSSGTLYISEYSNHRVMKYLSGASSGSIAAGGNGPGYNNTQLYNPVGLYFDSSSNSLFIANFGAHNIVRWTVGDSSWTLVAGISGSSGSTSTLLTTPGDVTLDVMGNVYVTDTGNHRVQLFLAGQSNGTTIAGVTLSSGSTSIQLNLPFGITVDTQFNVYVADYGNQRVQKFSHY